MFKTVLLQVGAAFFAVVIGGLAFGWRGALSAMLGGLACIIPSMLFAWRLHVASRAGTPDVSVFFIGEAIKIALAILILALVRLLYVEAHWGAVLIGLIITLQANFLALKLVKP